MDTFAPVFSKIVNSSLWDEDDSVVKIFLTMIAVKDRDHVVRLSAYNIARMARKTEEEVLAALRVLSEPDKNRLEPQPHDGRRIQRVEDDLGGGWLILNGEKYHQLMLAVFRRAKNAEQMRERRRLEKLGLLPKSKPDEPSVPATNHRFTPPTPEEASAYADEIKLPQEERLKFLDFYGSKGWKVGKSPMKDWKAAMRNWQRNASPGGNGARSVMDLKTVLSAKELLAGQIKDRYATSGALDTTWSDESKHEEWRKLRGEIKALQAQIAGMA